MYLVNLFVVEFVMATDGEFCEFVQSISKDIPVAMHWSDMLGVRCAGSLHIW